MGFRRSEIRYEACDPALAGRPSRVGCCLQKNGLISRRWKGAGWQDENLLYCASQTIPCSTVNKYMLMTVIKGMSPPAADSTMTPSPPKARTARCAIIVGIIVAAVTTFVAFLVGNKRLGISVKNN